MVMSFFGIICHLQGDDSYGIRDNLSMEIILRYGFKDCVDMSNSLLRRTSGCKALLIQLRG